MNIFNTYKKKRKHSNGFTLVELMVAIGIMVILSISLLVQQSKFDNSIYITNVANDLILTIRQAQSYSTNLLIGEEDAFEEEASYGVYIDKADGGTVTLYKNDKGGAPEFEGRDTVIETSVISGETSIKSICSGGNCGNKISISFKRPNPEPTIVPTGSEAKIILTNKDNLLRTITVLKTGLIEID